MTALEQTAPQPLSPEQDRPTRLASCLRHGPLERRHRRRGDTTVGVAHHGDL